MASVHSLAMQRVAWLLLLLPAFIFAARARPPLDAAPTPGKDSVQNFHALCCNLELTPGTCFVAVLPCESRRAQWRESGRR
jgi:hypothetical protein